MDSRRWTPGRKLEVVLKIKCGMPLDAAVNTYEVSKEEITAWVGQYRLYGAEGLRVGFGNKTRRRNNAKTK